MGPILKAATALRVRAALRRQGVGPIKITRLMRDEFDDHMIAGAAAEVAATMPGFESAFNKLAAAEADGTVGAIGDGSILANLKKAIEDFLASDFGKALVKALEAALLALLGL